MQLIIASSWRCIPGGTADRPEQPVFAKLPLVSSITRDIRAAAAQLAQF